MVISFQFSVLRKLRNGSSRYRWFSKLTAEEAGRKAETLLASLKEEEPQFSTRVAHSGMLDVPNAPMAPPIHLASTSTREASGIYREGDSKYSRMDNPTRLLLQKNVFELECIDLDLTPSTEATTFAFSSGMMAVTSIILAHNSPVTIIVPSDIYHGVPTALVEVFSRHSLKVRKVDMSEVSKVVDAICNSEKNSDVIVWMETPSNPLCQIIDIKAICDAVKSISSHQVTTVVDVTMSSPVLTRPLRLGADISMHSGTKYLAGHSDALIGLATVSPTTHRGKDLSSILKSVQIDTGGVASPWDCWLTLRGLRTLQVRLDRQCKTALSLAEFLNSQELVTRVHYPGLPCHPQHEVAKFQMNGGFGGVLSLEFDSEILATAFAGALKIIKRATSLGGTETLIEHRASVEPPSRTTSPPGLLRVSVGLEDPNDLINDVSRALAITNQIRLDEEL